MSDMAGAGAGMILVLFLLFVVLVICWIILPFAIIGTKPLLRQLLAEQVETNQLLRLKAGGAPLPPAYDPNAPLPPPSKSGRPGSWISS